MQTSIFDKPVVKEDVTPETSSGPENDRPDPERLQIMKLGSLPGSRYCFVCDRFELNVWMYLVGKRWMFLCAKVAAERGGVPWDAEKNAKEYEERLAARARKSSS